MQFLGLLGLIALVGCNRSNPALSPVAGVVTLNNQPIAGAQVRFLPQADTPGHGGVGITEADGSYAVIAHRSSNRKGLPPGDYKVVVSRLLMPDGTPPPPGTATINSPVKESVPDPYCKQNDTPLTVTIGEDAVTFDIPLKK